VSIFKYFSMMSHEVYDCTLMLVFDAACTHEVLGCYQIFVQGWHN
jgi:hypothetical protein